MEMPRFTVEAVEKTFNGSFIKVYQVVDNNIDKIIWTASLKKCQHFANQLNNKGL